MIEITNLFKTYGKIIALHDVSLHFKRGQCVALIGPNGSGKTTLMKAILQMVKPDSGSILVDGQSVASGNGYRQKIGYLPQLSRFPDHMRVAQLFSLVAGIRKDHERIDAELYERLGIDGYAKRTLGGLSEGMRQRVNACLAFYFDPEVLILDEPTASLDPMSSEIFRKKIADAVKKNRLVLISSHILSDLDDLATDVAYLMNGRLLFYKDLKSLKTETGEHRLNSIVPRLLQEMEVQYV
jgi:Cu-processing system ATP-binding protein